MYLLEGPLEPHHISSITTYDTPPPRARNITTYNRRVERCVRYYALGQRADLGDEGRVYLRDKTVRPYSTNRQTRVYKFNINVVQKKNINTYSLINVCHTPPPPYRWSHSANKIYFAMWTGYTSTFEKFHSKARPWSPKTQNP